MASIVERYIAINWMWLKYFTTAKKENQVRKLKEDKTRLESEIEALERKVERMNTMQKQVRDI